MDQVESRNARMSPPFKSVTVTYILRLPERSIMTRSKPMLKNLNPHGESSMTSQPWVLLWGTHQRHVKKSMKSETSLKGTKPLNKSICSWPGEKDKWKLLGDMEYSELMMLIVKKLNVFIRKSEIWRRSPNAKKILSTTRELEVSYWIKIDLFSAKIGYGYFRPNGNRQWFAQKISVAAPWGCLGQSCVHS